MGRSTNLTPEVQAAIVAKIEGGNFLSVAARCGGVTYKTFREWMKRGESDAEDDGIYRSFRDAVRRARAKAEADSVEFIKRSDTWSAHAWYLERSFQKRWMKREKAELPPPDFSAMSDDQILAFIKGLGARGPGA